MGKRKKKNSLVSDATDTVKVGATSMVGYSVLGGLSGVPGMPSGGKAIVPIAGAGLQLTNVGQLAKTGLNVTSSMRPKKKSKWW